MIIMVMTAGENADRILDDAFRSGSTERTVPNISVIPFFAKRDTARAEY